MESLEPATAYVKAASVSTGPMVALRAETALEELLTNSVVHGSAAPDEPASVWVSVTVAGQVMTLRFEDACAEFNPLLEIDAALERTRVPVEQRRPSRNRSSPLGCDDGGGIMGWSRTLSQTIAKPPP